MSAEKADSNLNPNTPDSVNIKDPKTEEISDFVRSFRDILLEHKATLEEHHAKVKTHNADISARLKEQAKQIELDREETLKHAQQISELTFEIEEKKDSLK
jgi:hypothetical protein